MNMNMTSALDTNQIHVQCTETVQLKKYSMFFRTGGEGRGRGRGREDAGRQGEFNSVY
jgi:hypothetical protein